MDDVHDSMMVRVSNKGFFPKSATVRRVGLIAVYTAHILLNFYYLFCLYNYIF